MRRVPHALVGIALLIQLCIPLSIADGKRTISSLGRLEPKNGVVQLAGPSGGGLSGAVIKALEVAEGEWVDKDQVVARLDSYDLHQAHRSWAFPRGKCSSLT